MPATVSSFLTVAGIFVLRWRDPGRDRPYKAFLYPLTPLIYLVLTGWTLAYIVIDKPVEALAGLGLMALGGLFYAASRALDM